MSDIICDNTNIRGVPSDAFSPSSPKIWCNNGEYRNLHIDRVNLILPDYNEGKWLFNEMQVCLY